MALFFDILCISCKKRFNGGKKMPIDYVSIIVIAIIIAIFIVFFIFKKQHQNNIVELKERKKELLEGLPTQRLDKVKKMDISGKSKAYAESLENIWEQILSGRNITVENHLFLAEQTNQRYQFKATRDYQQLAHEELQDIDDDLLKLSNSLEELINREEANAHRIHEIEKKYESVRKRLLDNSLSYGQAVDALEGKLADMEKEFEHFEKVTKWGDHEEARSVIIQLNEMIVDMQSYLNDVPKVLSTITEDFYPQLEEISESYTTLVNKGFVFNGSPIPEEVKEVDEKISILDELMGELKITEGRQLSQEIAEDIDNLYERMEIEVDASVEVDELIPSVQKAIYYLREEVRVLFFEIDRVSQSYVLIHNESDQIHDLKDSVEFLEGKFQKTIDNLENNFTPYSEVLKTLTLIKNELIQLNDTKNDVTDQLYSYRDVEVKLKEELSNMEQEARNIRRRIVRENLPGVPVDYTDFYTYVTGLLSSLSDELNRPRLKVEKTHDLIAICKEELKNLEERTQSVINNAVLTEMMAQKLYQYKEEYPDVAQTIAQSEKLFNEDYDYESSFTVVRNKLNSINPNMVQAVEQEYLAGY